MMSIFSTEELQFILNAVNEEVKRTGLNCAGMALVIAGKLQTMAAQPVEEGQKPQSAEDDISDKKEE